MGRGGGDSEGVRVRQRMLRLDRCRFENSGLGRQVQLEPVSQIADDRSCSSGPRSSMDDIEDFTNVDPTHHRSSLE